MSSPVLSPRSRMQKVLSPRRASDPLALTQQPVIQEKRLSDPTGLAQRSSLQRNLTSPSRQSTTTFQNPFGAGASNATSPLLGGVGNATSPLLGGTSNATSPLLGGAGNATSPLLGGAGNATSPLLGGTSNATSPLLGGTSNATSPLLGGTSNATSPLLSGTSNATSPLLGGTSNATSPLLGGAGNTTPPNPFGTLSGAINTALPNSPPSLSGAINTALPNSPPSLSGAINTALPNSPAGSSTTSTSLNQIGTSPLFSNSRSNSPSNFGPPASPKKTPIKVQIGLNTTIKTSAMPTTSMAPATTMSMAPATTMSMAPAATMSMAPAATMSMAPAVTMSMAPAVTMSMAPAITMSMAPATTMSMAPATTTSMAPAIASTSMASTTMSSVVLDVNPNLEMLKAMERVQDQYIMQAIAECVVPYAYDNKNAPGADVDAWMDVIKEFGRSLLEKDRLRIEITKGIVYEGLDPAGGILSGRAMIVNSENDVAALLAMNFDIPAKIYIWEYLYGCGNVKLIDQFSQNGGLRNLPRGQFQINYENMIIATTEMNSPLFHCVCAMMEADMNSINFDKIIRKVILSGTFEQMQEFMTWYTKHRAYPSNFNETMYGMIYSLVSLKDSVQKLRYLYQRRQSDVNRSYLIGLANTIKPNAVAIFNEFQ